MRKCPYSLETYLLTQIIPTIFIYYVTMALKTRKERVNSFLKWLHNIEQKQHCITAYKSCKCQITLT